MPRHNETRVANWLVSALTLGTLATCVPRLAHAHFHLDAPASWATQNATGDPQKSGPCGETNVANMTQAKATNMVTAFQPGQTIAVTITETVTHPGHYRVALATDRSMLPADPAVTAGASDCGSAEIDSTPEYPVLVDGALVHTAKFSGPQTIMVTLPSNVTCTKCTLQVIEFMSSHGLNNPGGCFYHHCADISIGAGGASSGGSGGGGGRGGTGAGGAGGDKGGAGGASGGAPNGGTANGGATNAGGTTQGGASASGGTTQGGSNGGAMSSGGQTASGGTARGGTTGTGGISATTGGTTSTGGAALSGGTTSTGGAIGAGTSNAGAAGSSPTDDAGCGCSVPGPGRISLASMAGLAALGGLLLRRRRR